MRLLVPIAALVFIGGGTAGCNGEENGNEPSQCVDYTTVDTQACGGPCSFATDVMPIFQFSCNLSGSCHTNRVALPAGEGLVLGPPAVDDNDMPVTPTQEEIDAVHGIIVNGTSVRSTMPVVKPGDLANSWLMVKLEYTDMTKWGDPGAEVCEEAFQACDSTSKGCGIAMPWNSPQLEPNRLAIVRAWIAAGAQNN